MASYLTSTTLIDSIKRRAMLPSNQVTFKTADFLAFANEELLLAIVPSLISVHEELFVVEEDIALVSNQSNYIIPERAIGRKIRDIFYKDTNGNLNEMTRINPDDRGSFQTNQFGNNYITYYLRGDEIIMCPAVGDNAQGYLTITYYLRPNELVEEDRVATITAKTVGASTTVFTVDLVPTIMRNGDNVDILQTKGGHKTRVFDITPVSNTTTSITFNNSDLTDDIAVGDYISLAGECIIPQIPDELHSFLAQKVAARCLEAMGDQNSLNAANTKLQEMEIKGGVLVDNRVEGSPQKVTNFNSLIRQGKVRRRGWY